MGRETKHCGSKMLGVHTNTQMATTCRRMLTQRTRRCNLCIRLFISPLKQGCLRTAARNPSPCVGGHLTPHAPRAKKEEAHPCLRHHDTLQTALMGILDTHVRNRVWSRLCFSSYVPCTSRSTSAEYRLVAFLFGASAWWCLAYISKKVLV